MSALAFRVHVDKENETPAAVMGKGAGSLKSFGPRQKNFVQSTPRKALFDVNNERQLSTNKHVPGKKDNFKLPSKNTSSALRIAKGGENTLIKKIESKGASSNTRKNILKVPEIKAPKVKAVVKTKVAPIPAPPKHDTADYEESEGESIFPRSERLSTYVGQLFSWRPPCLFGTIPDSEDSDLSDHDDLDDNKFPELLDISDFHLPELDVPELNEEFFSTMEPLPIPEGVEPLSVPEGGKPLSEQKTFSDKPQALTSQHSHYQSTGAGLSELSALPLPVPSEFDLVPTPDTSLSLGSLHVMTGSLDVSMDDAKEITVDKVVNKSEESSHDSVIQCL